MGPIVSRETYRTVDDGNPSIRVSRPKSWIRGPSRRSRSPHTFRCGELVDSTVGPAIGWSPSCPRVTQRIDWQTFDLGTPSVCSPSRRCGVRSRCGEVRWDVSRRAFHFLMKKTRSMSALAHGVRTVGNEFTRLRRYEFCTVEHTGGAVRQLCKHRTRWCSRTQPGTNKVSRSVRR